MPHRDPEAKKAYMRERYAKEIHTMWDPETEEVAYQLARAQLAESN